jgi:hypothetical protein
MPLGDIDDDDDGADNYERLQDEIYFRLDKKLGRLVPIKLEQE